MRQFRAGGRAPAPHLAGHFPAGARPGKHAGHAAGGAQPAVPAHRAGPASAAVPAPRPVAGGRPAGRAGRAERCAAGGGGGAECRQPGYLVFPGAGRGADPRTGAAGPDRRGPGLHLQPAGKRTGHWLYQHRAQAHARLHGGAAGHHALPAGGQRGVPSALFRPRPDPRLGAPRAGGGLHPQGSSAVRLPAGTLRPAAGRLSDPLRAGRRAALPGHPLRAGLRHGAGTADPRRAGLR